jgi:hypothetical protein
MLQVAETDVAPVAVSRIARTNEAEPKLMGTPVRYQFPVLGFVTERPAGGAPLASAIEKAPDAVYGMVWL